MNVAVVDDHILVVNGIKSMLKAAQDIQVVSVFNNGQEFLDSLEKNQPEILLLDINLPDISGIDICRKLTREYPQIAILALSNHNETSLVKTIIRQGAKGYILKNCTRQELITAIRSAQSDATYITESLKKQILEESLGKPNNTLFIPKLTRREKEVLQAIGDELASKEIAEKLFISIKTVEAHRKNLLQKFGAKNTAGLIKKAITKGLLK